MTLGIYNGVEKICFGLDLGTTMSAVSFGHFEDGVEPRIRVVTRWPGQEEGRGDCKVPTVVRYDSQGRAVQFGNEAVENEEGLENTTLAKWFKLHLHPAAMRAENDLKLPPLPSRVTIKKVYIDFLKYVFEHAQSYINTSTTINWNRLKNSFVIVMAIPNGWDDTHQAFLRSALVEAGVFPANHARDRLRFVSEAEASVHFAVNYGGIGSGLRKGSTLAVCDAGGSTVDTTVYTCTSAGSKLELKEVTSSECVQAGGVFVDESARQFLERRLATSTKFGTPDTIDYMVREFEKKTKRKFDGKQDKSYIPFGRAFDNERPLITNGRVVLTRDELKSIFKSPVAAIAASIDRILKRAGRFDSLLLVGGFAESAYLQAALGERLQAHFVKQINIDEPTKKAASEGAVAWFAKQCVVARAARAAYGTDIIAHYNHASAEHRQRSFAAYVDVAGCKMLPGAFSTLVLKNQVVQNDISVRESYIKRYASLPSSLAEFEQDIFCVDSAIPIDWYQRANGTVDERFRVICTLKADLSGLLRSLRPMTSPEGRRYWQVGFDIEIYFGQTSLCANLVWNEQGQARKGPVTVIPNSLV